MTANVIRLPVGARQAPHEPDPLGFFVRVGRSDHREILDLIASGERSICGLVVNAQNICLHRELIAEAGDRGFHVILDPQTQQMALPGSHTEQLAALPWGLRDCHQPSDFDGAAGRDRAAQIVKMAIEVGFTQILGPTHVLKGVNDPWLRRDINMMGWVAEQVRVTGGKLDLIYSLALPMGILRRRTERQALISAIADAPSQAIWLKVENFGDGASGEKTTAYIEACRDFHDRGLPVIGDHVGGLPGLATLAFGAVGGITHGVTMLQNFNASNWRRAPTSRRGGPGRRVYLPPLDTLLKPEFAQTILAAPRLRARCGCRDTRCCPQGVRDTMARPARHALFQRAREIEMLSQTPQALRASRYVEEHVRRVSDNVAAIAAFANIAPVLREKFMKKQGAVSRLRSAMAHLAEISPSTSIAAVPPRRRSPG